MTEISMKAIKVGDGYSDFLSFEDAVPLLKTHLGKMVKAVFYGENGAYADEYGCLEDIEFSEEAFYLILGQNKGDGAIIKTAVVDVKKITRLIFD